MDQVELCFGGRDRRHNEQGQGLLSRYNGQAGTLHCLRDSPAPKGIGQVGLQQWVCVRARGEHTECPRRIVQYSRYNFGTFEGERKSGISL